MEDSLPPLKSKSEAETGSEASKSVDRVKRLEASNARLKETLAEERGRIATLKETLVTERARISALNEQLQQRPADVGKAAPAPTPGSGDGNLRQQRDFLRAGLKTLQSKVRSSNSLWRRLLRELDDSLAAEDPGFEPIDPDAIRRATLQLKKTRVLQSPIFDTLTSGGTLADGLVKTIREAIDAREPYPATAFVHALLRFDETAEIGRLGMALLAFRRGGRRTAYDILLSLPSVFAWRHAPMEFAYAAYTVAPDVARQLIAGFAVEDAGALDPAARWTVARAAYGFGDRQGALQLVEPFRRDPVLLAALPEREQAAFNWFIAFVDAGPGVHAKQSPVNIAVIDYKLADLGNVSYNIGDAMQTLACMGNLVRHGGFAFEGETALAEFTTMLQGRVRTDRRIASPVRRVGIVSVHRDATHESEVPPGTWMIAFGWYMHSAFNGLFDFPFHPNIRPIFVSFHLNAPDVLTPAAIDYLKQYGPIGCRDWTTVYLLCSLDIPAYFSGCLTTTIDNLFEDPAELVDKRQFPQAFVDSKPTEQDEALAPIEMIDRRTAEVRQDGLVQNLSFALQHMEDLRGKYSRIVTSRLHCYLPSLSLGLDAEFRPRNAADVRYEGLMDLAPNRAAAVKVPMLARLATIFELITSGAEEHVVYARWREACAPDLEMAERACHPAPLPASQLDLGSALERIRAECRRYPVTGLVPNGAVIDLCFATDATWVDKLPVALQSLAAGTARPLRVWVLTRQLSDADFAWVSAGFPAIEFNFLPCDGVDYGENRRFAERIPVSTMDRLLLPHLLTEIGRVIYIDIDTMALGDIAELADLNLGHRPIAARAYETAGVIAHKVLINAALRLSPDRACDLRRRLYARSRMDFPTFNAGLAVLDLDRMRADDFSRNFIPYAEQFGLNDQDVLNCYTGPDFCPLPPGWNIVPRQELMSHPKLIHWAGRLKPWSDSYVLYREQWLSHRRDWLAKLHRIDTDEDFAKPPSARVA